MNKHKDRFKSQMVRVFLVDVIEYNGISIGVIKVLQINEEERSEKLHLIIQQQNIDLLHNDLNLQDEKDLLLQRNDREATLPEQSLEDHRQTENDASDDQRYTHSQ